MYLLCYEHFYFINSYCALSIIACENESNEESEDIDIDIPEFQSPEQIDELATLSLSSQSHWLNLLDLDVIKVINCFLFQLNYYQISFLNDFDS